MVGTAWRTSDIWIRRTFRADAAQAALTALRLHHDEDAEMCLNGQRVAALRGFITDDTLMLNEPLSRALRAGDNVIAVHCRKVAGGQVIDVGLELGRGAGKP